MIQGSSSSLSSTLLRSVVSHFEALPERRAVVAHGRHVPGELREPSGGAAQQARGGGQVSGRGKQGRARGGRVMVDYDHIWR